jgi:hypothetical protein
MMQELMGNQSSATTYLQNSTTTALYGKFNPVIKNSFTKVGADKVGVCYQIQ